MSFRSPRHRVRFATLLLGTLSVFLLGTNYCVIAAMSASRIACHAAIGSESKGHCCQGSTDREAPESSRPAAGFPCCIQIAPPASVDAVKPDLSPALFAILDVELEATSSTPSARHEVARREAPPPETLPDLLRGRAPPLS